MALLSLLLLFLFALRACEERSLSASEPRKWNRAAAMSPCRESSGREKATPFFKREESCRADTAPRLISCSIFCTTTTTTTKRTTKPSKPTPHSRSTATISPHQGVENLFERQKRMVALKPQPTFCDITWGAGGTTADLTLDIAARMQ